PRLVRPHRHDDFRPPPRSEADRRAHAQIAESTDRAARHAGLGVRAYVESRLGTAATLRALDAEAGGGFYAVPPEAEHDSAAADAALGGDQVVVDIPTHLVRPTLTESGAGAALYSHLRPVDPDRRGGDIA